MRKHIFGFALFSLIFAAFALVYAFFYAPSIPPKEAVNPPVSQTETETERPFYCRRQKTKISFEVLSSQFDLSNNELVSKVKVYWNSEDNPPEKIYLNTELFTLNQKEASKSPESLEFAGAFTNRKEATLIVLSKIGKDYKVDERQNLYITFNFSEIYSPENYSPTNKNIDKASQVLFVHKSPYKM
jgi:hypothetical protein